MHVDDALVDAAAEDIYLTTLLLYYYWPLFLLRLKDTYFTTKHALSLDAGGKDLSAFNATAAEFVADVC